MYVPVLLPCYANATTELQTLMGQERDFTRNVQRKHLQLLSGGDSDKAEELVLMAMTQLHAITQFTGVVRRALCCMAGLQLRALGAAEQPAGSVRGCCVPGSHSPALPDGVKLQGPSVSLLTCFVGLPAAAPHLQRRLREMRKAQQSDCLLAPLRDQRPHQCNLDDCMRMEALPKGRGVGFRDWEGVVTNADRTCQACACVRVCPTKFVCACMCVCCALCLVRLSGGPAVSQACGVLNCGACAGCL